MLAMFPLAFSFDKLYPKGASRSMKKSSCNMSAAFPFIHHPSAFRKRLAIGREEGILETDAVPGGGDVDGAASIRGIRQGFAKMTLKTTIAVRNWFPILIAAFLLSGCGGGIRSRLDISSEPTKATVFFDGEERGETPISIPFVWYWYHDIDLRKEGYQPLHENKRLRCKPWLIFPLDLIAEMMPFPIHGVRTFHYTLEPLPPTLEKGAP